VARDKLYLIPFHLSDEEILNPLDQNLARRFPLFTRVLRRLINIDTAFDAHRNQYHSTELLAQLIDDPPRDAARILGITSIDLFVPVLTFVFGEAQLDGIGALISTARLRNEFYGLPPDAAKYRKRIIKEAVHEMGHTYGLIHCQYPWCVMNQATYVDDVDERSGDFCENCAHTISDFRFEK
jgi:archaemetzincin